MPTTRKELLLATFVFLAIPVLVELTLRVAHYSAEPQLYAPDPARGWKLRANVTGVVNGENRQFVRINSHGFRDVEHSYEKPKERVRIAVLGNSWTEALQVPQEQTYTSVLQKILTSNRCFGGQRIEVLNFGVAGYSTAQELLTLQQEVWKYEPDIVLLAFYPARDIANNVRGLNNAVNPEHSPYFFYRDGRLIFDDSFRSLPALQPRAIALEHLSYQLDQHVRLLQAIGALQRIARTTAATAVVKEKAARAGVDNLEYSIYMPPADATMDEAWQVTEGLLTAVRDEVQVHNAHFRLVVLPTRPQLIPETTKRDALLHKLGVADFNYADQRIRSFCDRERISMIGLAPALSTFALSNHVYLNGFTQSTLGTGHWNATGHRVAAEAIAEQLCERNAATVEDRASTSLNPAMAEPLKGATR
jgi:hypothetical protein